MYMYVVKIFSGGITNFSSAEFTQRVLLHELHQMEMCLRSMHGQQRSNCMNAQFDQGLRCPQPESLDTMKCSNGEQRLSRDILHAQGDVNLHILHVFKGTFLLDATHIKIDFTWCT